jgi:hypothetical protein
MGITVYANSSGRARLWINGNLTTDYSGQTMATGGTIYRIEMNGTIGQPGYDAPAHYRQFDRIILTDNWQLCKWGQIFILDFGLNGIMGG